MFNLETALSTAKSAAEWEAIARHLIAANKPKAKRASKKSNGPQTWATVRLTDGRVFLTSAYARATEAQTIAAHSDYAQYRGRMEDSGDRDNNCGRHISRVYLNPAIQPVPVARVDIITDPAMVENCRNFCFEQRGQRQGWLSSFAIAAE